MDSNYSQTSVENGANPEMIWGSIYEYLLRRGKFMEKEFKKRRKMRQPQPFTWNDIDNVYALIRQDLDDIVKGTSMYLRNTQSQSQPQQSPSQLQQPPQQGQLGDSIIPRFNIIKECNNQNNCNRNMKNKKVVRLTESQLHSIIGESVKKIINEMNYNVLEDEETLQEHLNLIGQFMNRYFQGGGMTSSNPYEYLSSAIEQTESLLLGLNILARRRNLS